MTATKESKIRSGSLIKLNQLDYETGFIFIFNARAKEDPWDSLAICTVTGKVIATKILDEEVMDGYLNEIRATNKSFLRGLNFSELKALEKLEKTEEIGLIVCGPIKKIVPALYWSMFSEKLENPEQTLNLYKVFLSKKLFWVGSESINLLV